MENKGKGIEKVYYIAAILLIIVFLFSFFIRDLSSYFGPKVRKAMEVIKFNVLNVEEYYSSLEKKEVMVGDTIYFSPRGFTDNFSLYAYNTVNKTLDRITDDWVNRVESYKDSIYFLDAKNMLFRIKIKDKIIEKILENCRDFQISNNKIAYIDTQTLNVNIYNLEDKTKIDLKIQPHGFLFINDFIYYFYFSSGDKNSIFKLDINTRKYDVYTVNGSILGLMYYNGKFYAQHGTDRIACYDDKFEKIWEVGTQGEYKLLSKIIKDKIYFYAESNGLQGSVLMSIDLNGKNIKKEMIVKNNSFSNFEYVCENNKNYIFDIKTNKRYELPDIKSHVFYFPIKKQVNALQGYKMVKTGNKFYYIDSGINFNQGSLVEYDFANKTNNVYNTNLYLNDIKFIEGNLFVTAGKLYNFDLEEKKTKLISNVFVDKIFTNGDNIYVSTFENLYKVDDRELIKILDKVRIVFFNENKIYFYPKIGDVYDVTKLKILDLNTNKTSELSIDIDLFNLIYIDNEYAIYTQGNDILAYDLKKGVNKILYKGAVFIEGYLLSKDKLFLKITDDQGKNSIDCIYLDSMSCKTLVREIGYINSYLYDEEQNKIYYTISNYLDVLEVKLK
ncbi:hypothetical protein [Thermobrachium celere]|uniref:hypothetical protein n=1 Tax=Thermobrachium celere TaxID=53422 RepID=UPI0019433678|nr:hypothetical protein [Thermobrachium celere]GFR36159.1 hypothetical protein TCEA9_19710 [Thermobrachium celere]